LRRLAGDPAFTVRAAVRKSIAADAQAIDVVTVGDIGPDTDWSRAVAGIDVVIHLAARVHVMRETAGDPLAEFRRVNVAGTESLVRRAAAAGVRRIVYASSVKVNGDRGRFTEADAPAPVGPYGVSKAEAEALIRRLAAECGVEAVIIRPPLVYGPGVKGNFRSLMRAIEKGIPLPLGGIENRRSLVAVDNLVDFIITCTTHPAAAGETFLVSDGEDISTTALIRRLADAMGGPPRVFHVPAALLRTGARLVGRLPEVQRLLETLEVDVSKARRRLGWRPPLSVTAGLARIVNSTTLRAGK